jgi:hypothetical protein
MILKWPIFKLQDKILRPYFMPGSEINYLGLNATIGVAQAGEAGDLTGGLFI